MTFPRTFFDSTYLYSMTWASFTSIPCACAPGPAPTAWDRFHIRVTPRVGPLPSSGPLTWLILGMFTLPPAPGRCRDRENVTIAVQPRQARDAPRYTASVSNA